MKEIVGKVKLNLDFYEGKDLYSDGDIENELLNIVKDYDSSQYNDVILDKNSWAVLYHLSKQRENILKWYPFEKNASILEVGAGCGAVTGALLTWQILLQPLNCQRKEALLMLIDIKITIIWKLWLETLI